ncbi:SpoIIE family protein phosphatase [Streptomyces sp. SPB074]|uniref:SpoIIE family protein phosphatase n=1 Tax=Streptomyces sp. (strain SPB074) TaxID=465543 RepID=UPI0001D1DEB6|nr:SpoIIE family protein phosphatase [Streptomyces sp. SPB074]EDY44513.2 membrane protein [Streptomyces sp. SPB074]
MSEIPARAAGPRRTPDEIVWQSSPAGSIYDYLRVAAFSIGPDGTVDQWSERAERLFGLAAEDVVGRDPVETFVPPRLRGQGHRKLAEILDGREWTGIVPFRLPARRDPAAREATLGEGPDPAAARPDPGAPASAPGHLPAQEGTAEIYVMPTRTEDGDLAAVCIAVDVRTLRGIETDLAASQAIFGQSPFGFVLFGTDLRIRRVNERFASVFGPPARAHQGRAAEDYLVPAQRERLEAALRHVLEKGGAVNGLGLTGTVPGEDQPRHWSLDLYRVHSGTGRPLGVAALATDVTRRQAAAREAASARRNLALLNEAGSRIGNSLDLETTARELLDVAVPGFCDLASVDLYQALLTGEEQAPGMIDGSAELRRVAFASAVADVLPFLRQREHGGAAPGTGTRAGTPGPGTGTGAPGPGPEAGAPGAGPATGGPAQPPPPAAAPPPPCTGPSPEASPEDRMREWSASPAGPFTVGRPSAPGTGRRERGRPWYGYGPAPEEARRHGAGAGSVDVGAVHRYPSESPRARVLRTARSELLPGTDGDLVQSTLAVPMVAHDKVVGLAQFARTKGSEPFGERDRALAAELASRTAVFIDNARLYRREHERALLLQRSLLPPGEPEAAGLDIACRYLPGNEATEVGGDWFDVIELPGHRTALVVGDVMGRGLRAAAAMGELRTAVRTLALLDLEPAEVLSHLDEIAQGLGSPQQTTRPARQDQDTDLAEVYLATCVYAVYDSVTRRCTFANAGHLPPVLLEPSGAQRPALLLDVPPGMPLGVGGEPFEEVTVELPEGALLALYTDGLVESRHQPLDEGLLALRNALTDPGRSLEDICDQVLRRLDTHHGEDDIALLMARVQGLPAENVGDWTLPRDPQSVGKAREFTRERLAGWGLEALADTTELLVSELVTNALRYGDGEIRLRLLLDRTLVCEVWDEGLVQPRRRRAKDTDEGGRGLQLVGLLAASWGSRRTPHGKTVWFELGLPDGESNGVDAAEALLSLF